MGYIYDGGTIGGNAGAGAGGEPIPGPAGPPNVLTVGTVTTLAPGEQATVEITGTSPEQVVNFGIPEGEPGEPAPADAYTPLNPPPAISTLPQNIDGNTPGGMDAIQPNSIAHVGGDAEGNTTGNTINVIDMTIGPDSFQLCSDPNDSRTWIRTKDSTGWKLLKELLTAGTWGLAGDTPRTSNAALETKEGYPTTFFSQWLAEGENRFGAQGVGIHMPFDLTTPGALNNSSNIFFHLDGNVTIERLTVDASTGAVAELKRGKLYSELNPPPTSADVLQELSALREEVEQLKAMMKKS